MGKLQTNTHNFIQQTTLDKLKCTNCRKYLSILPIYKNSKAEAFCGRCPIDLKLVVRDELYEHAIEFQKFPCSYRECGCLQVLFPSRLAEHEKRCPYMKHECPTKVYNNCRWQGILDNVLDHFEKKHPTFILKDRFEVDFVNNHKENYIMPYTNDLYIVTREANSEDKTFAIEVKHLGTNMEIEEYLYNVTLESGNKSYKYSIQQNIGTRLQLQAEIISAMLHDPITIIANISIITSKKQKKSDSDNDDDEDSALDHEQLESAECSICKQHMVPPIYQCEIGHSICKICNESHNVCPCKGSFKQTRNFAMEKLIMNMTYPCKHQGCKFTTKARFIRQHEAGCLHSPFSCPLKDYENCAHIFPASQLFNHIKNTHYENLLELDTISVPFDGTIEEDITEGYILRYGQCLFKLCFMYKAEESKFLWSVQLMGLPEDSSKYSYELEIIDNNGRNKRLYLKTQCSPLADQSETFQTPENYVYLHNDQISTFINDQLTYRIQIVNNK